MCSRRRRRMIRGSDRAWRKPEPASRAARFQDCASLHPGSGCPNLPDGQNTRHAVNPRVRKYSALPKFGNGVCVVHPGSSLRGDLVVVLVASRACGGRGSVGTRVAGRAGSPCEPETACGRTALPGFVSSVSFRLRRQGRENCGDMAGRAYGKTVWSWPSLLRSSLRGGVCEPNRADSIVNSRGEGGQKESSAPGRARHKPSDHRAGKAE